MLMTVLSLLAGAVVLAVLVVLAVRRAAMRLAVVVAMVVAAAAMASLQRSAVADLVETHQRTRQHPQPLSACIG